ncbi:STAS domain-containing protein [Neotabrizicola sp. VNH66]|uniref:STAS domain-containing protein n=1 Tax=Neotabrizicola sp. VNH66 TaxID=3400918 RepID=UPI003C0FA9D7
MIKTSQPAPGITVVEPQFDRLTAANANGFKTALTELVEAGHNLLVIDFAPVSFVDSSGVGALVGLLKRVGNRGEIALCGLNESVLQLFRITRMDRVFSLQPDTARAISALQS